MSEPTEPPVQALVDLRDPLHAGLDQVQRAAGAIRNAEAKFALGAASRALDFLEGEVLPHCRAEEYTVFPSIDGILGAPGATAVLAAQHRAVEAMVGDLRKVVDAATSAGTLDEHIVPLEALLWGLYASVRVHIESEDDIFLPLIADHLSESQIGVIEENLRRITASPSSEP